MSRRIYVRAKRRISDTAVVWPPSTRNFADVSDDFAIMPLVDEPERAVRDPARDAAANEAARVEILRADARRSLGENLEQADALIKAAFELAEGFAAAER